MRREKSSKKRDTCPEKARMHLADYSTLKRQIYYFNIRQIFLLRKDAIKMLNKNKIYFV